MPRKSRKANPSNPSVVWYFNDYESEPGLKYCSLATEGLWMRMLGIAARSREYGFVLVGDHPSTIDDLPRLLAPSCKASAEEIKTMIDDLITFKVAEVDDGGRVYNRKMARRASISATRSEVGKRGAEAKKAGKQKGSKGGGKEGGNAPSKPGGKEGSKTEAIQTRLSVGDTIEISGRPGSDGKQNGSKQASNDTSKGVSKPEASSVFQSSLMKEEDRNTGVVTTAGHAAEAGGPCSSDHPGSGSKPAKPTRDRGIRIPDDWTPTPELEQFARDRGLDPAEVALEFRTYWGSRAGREALKVNWGLAFKNNCIKLSGHLRSSRPQAVALRREQQQGELEQFARGGMAGAESTPPKGIYRR